MCSQLHFLGLPTEIRRLVYSFINEPLTLHLYSTRRASNNKELKYNCQAYLARDNTKPRALSPSLLVSLSRVCWRLRNEIQHEFGDEDLDAENIIGEGIMYFPSLFDMREFGEKKTHLMEHVQRVRTCIDGVDNGQMPTPRGLAKKAEFPNVEVAEYFSGGPRAKGDHFERFSVYLEEGWIPETSKYRADRDEEEEHVTP